VDLKDLSHGWIRFTAVPADVAEWFYDLRQASMTIPISYEDVELSS
jgi:hypothetical protein